MCVSKEAAAEFERFQRADRNIRKTCVNKLTYPEPAAKKKPVQRSGHRKEKL